jgi:hypothetical protein
MDDASNRIRKLSVVGKQLLEIVLGNGTTDDVDPMKRFVCFQNLEEDVFVHLLVPGNVESLERAQTLQDGQQLLAVQG